MPSDPCREDFRPMSKETFLQTMERFWMHISRSRTRASRHRGHFP